MRHHHRIHTRPQFASQLTTSSVSPFDEHPNCSTPICQGFNVDSPRFPPLSSSSSQINRYVDPAQLSSRSIAAPKVRIQSTQVKVDAADTKKPVCTKSGNSKPTATEPCIADIPLILGPEEATECKYIRHSQIGAGSFAQAWLIERRSDHQLFAAKVLVMSKTDSNSAVRAQSEVQCLQSCSHFACLSYVEHFEFENKFIIIMEYCDAGDLASYISDCQKTEQQFPEPNIEIIILQLVLALEHMHRRKILHRDIKARNVFLSTTGLVKVGDFGLSNEYETVSGDVAKTICGTPYYLAPEVWNRERYDSKADVWALGVLSYELITGRCPFVGKDLVSLVGAIVSARSKHQVELDATTHNVSQELVDTVKAMLTKDRSKRPTTLDLLERPYLQNALRKFLPIVDNTDRLPHELKVRIRRAVEEVEESMAVAASKKILQRSQSPTEGSTVCSHTSSASQLSPKESLVSGDGGATGVITAAGERKIVRRQAAAKKEPEGAVLSGAVRSIGIAVPPASGASSLSPKPSVIRKTKKVKSPKSNLGENKAAESIIMEGPVRKHKASEGVYKNRYLYLMPDSISVVHRKLKKEEEEMKVADGKTVGCTYTRKQQVEGAFEDKGDGGELECGPEDILIPPERAGGATAPPSPAVPTPAQKKGAPLSLTLIKSVSICQDIPSAFVITTTTAHAFTFEATNAEMWVTTICEALKSIGTS